MRYPWKKRIVDLLGSTFLIALTSPVLLACVVAIICDSRGPVFFRQQRLGLGGKVFSIFKFRTMIPNAVKQGAGLMTFAGDNRVTKVGNILRKYRLDELAQLFNVLLGDMSLVGPRPLLPEFLDGYTATDKKRLLLPPGMTGWQQINGGSGHSWEERIEYDVWYVEHWSFWLDMLILIRTPLVVLKADSVYGKDGRQMSGVPRAYQNSLQSGEKEAVI